MKILSFYTGVCTTNGKIHASIVIAGDPKQLDAVTKSRLAEEMGFKTSFLENLFNQKLYKRDPNTGKFNGKYIIQLERNYRSHPVILKIPNESFYDGTLRAEASKGRITNTLFDLYFVIKSFINNLIFFNRVYELVY